MQAGFDPAKVSQCSHNANSSVAAHPEEAYVIEKYDRSGGVGLDWVQQQSADNHFRAARFTHYPCPKIVKFGTKTPQPLGNGSGPKIRPPGDHNPCGFTLSVGIDDMN
jgi:hypothetical protein